MRGKQHRPGAACNAHVGTYSVVETRTLQFGYRLFRNGAAAPLAGLGRGGGIWHWGYVQVTFDIGGRSALLL